MQKDVNIKSAEMLKRSIIGNFGILIAISASKALRTSLQVVVEFNSEVQFCFKPDLNSQMAL